MALAGLTPIIIYQAKKFIPYEKYIMPGIIFGALLPNIEIIFISINLIFQIILKFEQIFQRPFTHSIFTSIFIYLLFAILAEFKKNKKIKIVGKGIAIGMLMHYLIDIILPFNHVDFLWPLPIQPISLWYFREPPKEIITTIMILEFFCFRCYAWFLIKQHLVKPNKYSWIIKHINKWKKIESLFFILFILFAILESPNFNFMFTAAYIPSLIIALFFTYMSRDALNYLPT